MKRKSVRKTLIVALALMVAVAMIPSMAFAQSGDDTATEWTTSKSKIATNLDENFESEVTLSLPAAEENPVTDVVFVLDRSGSSVDARNEINKMLEELVGIVGNSDAQIKVGIVNFSYQADKCLELTNLTEDSLENIKSVVELEKISGTNIEAGIEAGVAMLDADESVSDANKYLVLLTDGISHAWNGEDGTPMTVWGEGMADSKTVQNGANSYYYFKDKTNAISFEELYKLDANDDSLNSGYEVPVYIGENTELTIDDLTEEAGAYYGKYIKMGEYDKYLTGVEKGVYTAAHAYADAASKYKCISLYWNLNYPIATEFMKWTETKGAAYNISSGNDLEEVFNSVERNILYLLDAGSFVVDEIGYDADYNFDFVNEIEALKLTVGEGEEQEILECEKIDTTGDNDITSAYGFGENTDGDYRFVLNYCENGTTLPVIDQDGNESELGYEECFVWEINEPIQITAPVQLTYKVKLTNPKTAAGVYGTYDADGSKGYEGLYTNLSLIHI